METVLRMENITKTFGRTRALSNVDFDLKAGEIHALLGENGAGKSTLIKVLGGIYEPDRGSIWISGEQVKINHVADARKLGIGIIHQEIVLVQHLTVAENIFLGREIRAKAGIVDKRQEYDTAQKMIDDLGIRLNARDLVKDLTIAQQQLVEIIKAVSFDLKVLVMDEPTSSLSEEEVESLFKIMKRLKEKQVGIIYISHRFDELYRISDRITIMRDGEYIATVETKEADSNELVKLMVGRSMTSFYVKDTVEPGEVVLKVDHLTRKPDFEDVSFEVRAGQIVGFSGLMGAGRSEIMLSLFGATRFSSGEITFQGRKRTFRTIKEAIDSGIGMVPEDRKKLGLVLANSVGYNISLAKIRDLAKKGVINRKKKTELVDKYGRELSIKTASMDALVSTLSGGNQQKVLVSKWIATNPVLLILDEPTRGIDIGAKQEIYTIMNELARQGMAIILISSELPEVIHMSDVIYVVRNGRIVKRFEHGEFSQEDIMSYATGGKNE